MTKPRFIFSLLMRKNLPNKSKVWKRQAHNFQALWIYPNSWGWLIANSSLFIKVGPQRPLLPVHTFSDQFKSP